MTKRTFHSLIVLSILGSITIGLGSILCSLQFSKTIEPWSRGDIPYVLVGKFTLEETQTILESMKVLESHCNIKFILSSKHGQAIYHIIKREDPKYATATSSVGWREQNSNYMEGGQKYCFDNISVMLHELGHCLGMTHEHQRPDRDKYVIINFNNIQKGYEKNFQLLNERDVLYNYKKYPYDYQSIMHYYSNWFAVVPKDPVIKALNGKTVGGYWLTQYDILKLQTIYGKPRK